ncbi:GNAT family N-acetyltransferase [Streptomyces pseudogriseolus]|uniref:GNAT family N-acetyltransferase n=1 Tax=Streptomyces pseudogriseolus TaxID=36817 RepID=UPI003FA1BD3A
MPTTTIRPATPADAAAVTALMNQVDELEIGRPETDLHTVLADLEHPDTDLERDSWLVTDGEQVVVFGLLWDPSGGERIDVDLYALPSHQAEAARTVAAMEARALERARANGAARAVVHLHLNAAPTLDTGLLSERGWRVVRRYHVLHRPLDPTRDPLPEPPAGVRVRACVTEEDRVRVHALYQESFAGHFDFQPRSYATWLHDVDARGMDWNLVWIVTAGDLGDCGFLMARDDREAMGWIRSLGVLPAARGRGLAGLLLRHAFGVFAARGRDTVGLGVDTRNATGAPRLYERHGLTLHYAVDTWETTVR